MIQKIKKERDTMIICTSATYFNLLTLLHYLVFPRSYTLNIGEKNEEGRGNKKKKTMKGTPNETKTYADFPQEVSYDVERGYPGGRGERGAPVGAGVHCAGCAIG